MLEMKTLTNRDAKYFLTDRGTEFRNDIVRAYEKTYNVTHLFVAQEEHVYMIERHNAIVKSILDLIQRELPLTELSTLTYREIVIAAQLAKSNVI